MMTTTMALPMLIPHYVRRCYRRTSTLSSLYKSISHASHYFQSFIQSFSIPPGARTPYQRAKPCFKPCSASNCQLSSSVIPSSPPRRTFGGRWMGWDKVSINKFQVTMTTWKADGFHAVQRQITFLDYFSFFFFFFLFLIQFKKIK